jgi:hypothetical protein
MQQITKSQVGAREKRNKMHNILRAKLRKLCSSRFGNHYLPDSEDGRAMLAALLCFGLTDDSAINDASWCEAELPALKRKARRIKWHDVGKLIGLTFDEWKAAKLWIMRPIDKSEAELDAWRKDRRKVQDSVRKKRQREHERSTRETMRAADNRRDAVLQMLEARGLAFPRKSGVIPPPRFCGEWTPISTLMELAVTHRAFRRPDGRALRDLRKTIHRTLTRLAKSGVVETRLEQGQRGKVTLIRKHGSMASAFPQKAQQTKGFEPQRTLSAGKADIVALLHNDPVSTPPKVVHSQRRKVA